MSNLSFKYEPTTPEPIFTEIKDRYNLDYTSIKTVAAIILKHAEPESPSPETARDTTR